MHSRAAIEWHFWLSLAGIMLYVTAMWGAGVMQGLMWRAYTELGFLKYSFIDTVVMAGPYYLPKQADAPIWSYRLSIVSFWSLVFMYMWAGPHHLHYTSLPDWVQTLGMSFTIMLWMPSWALSLIHI